MIFFPLKLSSWNNSFTNKYVDKVIKIKFQSDIRIWHEILMFFDRSLENITRSSTYAQFSK